jgi:RNA polymerase sigma factor for flagellar operon FliA
MNARRLRGLDLLERPDRVEASLWRSHRDAPGALSRQRLFEHYQPFARKLGAYHFSRRKADNFERGDVEQLAYEALLQAIDRYDPGRNVPFEAYARLRIAGHINNCLPAMSEASAQYRFRKRTERDRLRSLREGGSDDAAQDAMAALSQLAATLALGLMLEDSGEIDPDSLPDPQPSAYESLAWHEMKQKIMDEIAALPAREADVIRKHYQNGVSFQQIAELMGVSKGRISQIHRAALQRLREQLARFR